ncbi:B3 domain-containing protein [Quillaja saponaria]|nr:B3 domain-containing protein [Quillaja saponaria]
MIFDPSALEIDYLSYDEETEESSDSVEILDEMPLIFLGHDKKRGYNPKGELESNSDELATQTPSFSNKSRVSGSLEAARRFSSKNPFFNITMKLYHNIYGGSTIPIDFARRHMKRNNQKVTLNVGSRSWISKVVHYPKYSYARFTSGWGSFARENNLKDGDACFFELINSDDLMFKVSIFRS